MRDITLRGIFIIACVVLSTGIDSFLVDASIGTSVHKYHLDKKVFCVASGDFDKSPSEEIVIGCTDNHLYFLSAEGKELWRIDVQGLPYSICVADINGDGTKEILVISQDSTGSLLAVKYKKGVMWRFSDNQALLSLAIGDLERDGKKEVAVGGVDGTLYILDAGGVLKRKKVISRRSSVTALCFGNLDGNRGDEVVVGTSKDGLYALDNTDSFIWRIDPKEVVKKLKRKKQSSHPQHGMQLIRTIAVQDILGDSRNEIIVGSRPSGLVTVLDERGHILWQRNFPHLVNMWSTAQVAVGNVLNDVKREIVCLLQGIGINESKGTTPVVVMDGTGRVLGEVVPRTSFFGLDLAGSSGTDKERLILSSSFSGTGFFKVGFSTEGTNQLRECQDEIDRSVENLLNSLNTRAKPKAEKRDRRFHFLVRTTPQRDPREMSLGEIRFDRGSTCVEAVLKGVYEKTIRRIPRLAKSKRGLSQTEVLNIVRQYEKRNIPFYLNIGKHCILYFQFDTLEKILNEAKNTCKGFVVDEDGRTGRKWKRFLQDMEQVLNILSRNGRKKLVMNEYRDFWYRVPFEKDGWSILFSPRYRDIIIPVYKPSVLHAPELNLGSIVGLWKSEAVRSWGVGVYEDMWKWESDFIGVPGNVLLRFMVMASSLGANYFLLSSTVMDGSRDAPELAEAHRPYFKVFEGLIATGALFPAQKREDVFACPVAICKWRPPAGIDTKQRGSVVPWNMSYLLRGPLRAGFPLQVPREEYIPGCVYNLAHHYDGMFPTTPNGFVCILPEGIKPSQIEGIKDWWVVDGQSIRQRNGKQVSMSDSERLIGDGMKRYRDRLPVTAGEVFVSTWRVGEEHILFLVCPDMLPTSSVRSSIDINLDGKTFRVIDAVSGDKVPTKGGTASVDIPAGLFKILRIRALRS